MCFCRFENGDQEGFIQVANGHGGIRAGAGRKPKDPDEYKGTMRGLFETCVTKADWETVIFVALAAAKCGDKAARDWLSPWIVGKVPDEVQHEVTVKGYIGFSPDEWDRDTKE